MKADKMRKVTYNIVTYTALNPQAKRTFKSILSVTFHPREEREGLMTHSNLYLDSLLSQKLLSTYYMPATVLVTEDTGVNKTAFPKPSFRAIDPIMAYSLPKTISGSPLSTESSSNPSVWSAEYFIVQPLQFHPFHIAHHPQSFQFMLWLY